MAVLCVALCVQAIATRAFSHTPSLRPTMAEYRAALWAYRGTLLLNQQLQEMRAIQQGMRAAMAAQGAGLSLVFNA